MVRSDWLVDASWLATYILKVSIIGGDRPGVAIEIGHSIPNQTCM